MTLPLAIRVELASGTSDVDAIDALWQLAAKLDCTVIWTDRDGIEMLATPGARRTHMLADYQRERMKRLGQVKPGALE